MKRLFSAATAIAALTLAGCDGASAPRDTAPADETTGGSVTTQIAPTASSQPGEPAPAVPRGGGHTDDPDQPGVPGSPISYDHTRLGASPGIAQSDIRGDIKKVCGANLCGVKVLVTGEGDCISSITESPVKPGGTVKIQAVPCKPEVTEEATTSESQAPASEQPSETKSASG